MTQGSAYLDNIYSVARGDEMRRYYDDWADSYDSDLEQNDYRTPARCAQALARFVPDRSAPVLDFACGTGISGEAMAEAGFTVIDGTDISDGMLHKARSKGAYRELWLCDADRPLDLGGRDYAAIVAVGAIGAGAAPVENIDAAIAGLARGGVFIVSLNDHTLQDPDYEARINAAAKDGRIEILQAEDGPHLPSIGLNARVYAVRKL